MNGGVTSSPIIGTDTVRVINVDNGSAVRKSDVGALIVIMDFRSGTRGSRVGKQSPVAIAFKFAAAGCRADCKRIGALGFVISIGVVATTCIELIVIRTGIYQMLSCRTGHCTKSQIPTSINMVFVKSRINAGKFHFIFIICDEMDLSDFEIGSGLKRVEGKLRPKI